MSEEKTYTIDEAKIMGRKFVEQQAKILEQNLVKKSESIKDFAHV